MDTFTFTLGEEVRPKIETGQSYKDSVFKSLYAKAESLANSFLSDPKRQTATDEDYNVDKLNNIIAFVGDRGSGKTSAMLSFLKRLEEKETPLITSHSFLPLNIVDPSFFDDSHNILDLVLGRMFTAFKETLKEAKRNTPDDESRKRILIHCFQTAKEYNDILHKKDKSEDSLDALQHLSAGSQMKNAIKKLVDAYLEFMGEGKDKSILVIPVDDIDLHVEGGYKMVEEIRKYLVQPNILILLSVKLEQLQDVIKEHLSKHFKKTRDTLTDSLDLMAERYLAKLIPLDHRIETIDVLSVLDCYCSIKLS